MLLPVFNLQSVSIIAHQTSDTISKAQCHAAADAATRRSRAEPPGPRCRPGQGDNSSRTGLERGAQTKTSSCRRSSLRSARVSSTSRGSLRTRSTSREALDRGPRTSSATTSSRRTSRPTSSSSSASGPAAPSPPHPGEAARALRSAPCVCTKQCTPGRLMPSDHAGPRQRALGAKRTEALPYRWCLQ